KRISPMRIYSLFIGGFLGGSTRHNISFRLSYSLVAFYKYTGMRGFFMERGQQQPYSRNMILTFFMISTFAIGMTEYVVTGLLTQFAADFSVPVSTTGLLLSAYAIGVA